MRSSSSLPSRSQSVLACMHVGGRRRAAGAPTMHRVAFGPSTVAAAACAQRWMAVCPSQSDPAVLRGEVGKSPLTKHVRECTRLSDPGESMNQAGQAGHPPSTDLDPMHLVAPPGPVPRPRPYLYVPQAVTTQNKAVGRKTIAVVAKVKGTLHTRDMSWSDARAQLPKPEANLMHKA